MAVRTRLAFERLALLLFDMQLRYGPVIRKQQVFLTTREARCIACAQQIEPGLAYVAQWTNRPTSGFYAHDFCPPLESEWLADTEYYQVFDYFVQRPQRCADCRSNDAQVRVVVPALFIRGGIALRYVCNECVARPVRSRT